MTTTSRKNQTALAKWLFENNIGLHEGGRFFKCSHEQLRRIAGGVRRARGETAELILEALTGQKTVEDFRKTPEVAS